MRTYLEMRSPADLRPARCAGRRVLTGRVEHCPPAVWRRLYTEVGAAYRWVDRLRWTDDEIVEYLASPGTELWVMTVNGTPAGYFELRSHEERAIEIAYFGLLPQFMGRGLGKHLLTVAVERAWASGAARVWLHTCSLDHPAALPNYLARGFSIFKTERFVVPA